MKNLLANIVLGLLFLGLIGVCFPGTASAGRLPQVSKLPVAPALPRTATTCDCLEFPGNCTCATCQCGDYATAYQDAVDSGKLFVCFVGTPGRKIRNCATCYVPKYRDVVEGGPAPAHNPCVVVAEWRDGNLRRLASLNPEATDAEILSYRAVATPVPVLYQPRTFFGGGPMMGGFGGGCAGGGCR